MLLQHAFGKLRSSRTLTLRSLEQEWEKQGGFGPVVLVEVGSQLSQCEVELGSDLLARTKAF
jgi:hypothetical protein